ncbi:hypothetical protein F4778DRAFT_752067 [Xylariomycetidae sp. FL2044]|nr:hypothetical protein F4778DRAFT_752067 [Xylariomycetidae sp. FL2044]
MPWNATNELSPVELDCEKALLEHMLETGKCANHATFKRTMAKAEPWVVEQLFKRSHPPTISRSYLYWLACYNYFRQRSKKEERFILANQEPEHHAQPYSLAYVEYWYDETHKDGAATDADDDGKIRVVPAGREPGPIEPLMVLWQLMNPHQLSREGHRPFEVTIPAFREVGEVLPDVNDVENLEAYLDRASDLFGSEFAVFCKLGGFLERTTVFLSTRPGVDLSRIGVRRRFGIAWDSLLEWGIEIITRPVELVGFLSHHMGHYMGYNAYPEQRWDLYTHEVDRVKVMDQTQFGMIRACGQWSQKVARLCKAQQQEIDRISNEVSKQLVMDMDHEGKTRLAPLKDRAKRLNDFVTKGDDRLPFMDSKARLETVQQHYVVLAADIVRAFVSPESVHTLEEQQKLVLEFILDGDERINLALGERQFRLDKAREISGLLSLRRRAVTRCELVTPP